MIEFTKEELEAIYQLADNAQAKGIESKQIVLNIMVKVDSALKTLSKEVAK